MRPACPTRGPHGFGGFGERPAYMRLASQGNDEVDKATPAQTPQSAEGGRNVVWLVSGLLRAMDCQDSPHRERRTIILGPRNGTMKINLSGRTALVTGSTEGIGFAIAKGLHDAGA